MTIHSLSTAALCTVIACALACLGPMPSASAQCQYEVTAIIQGPGCPPSNTPAPVVARGMNAHGHVVGSWRQCFQAADEAFFWSPETGLVTLPRPADVHSATAGDINDSGQIIGRHLFVGVAWKGFVYDIKTQRYTYLEPMHGMGEVTLNAINNAGIAVGSRSIGKPGQSPNPSNAVIWNTNTGEVIDLGVGEGPNSAAMDVNEAGEKVGWSGTSQGTIDAQASLWINRDVVYLGMLPGHIQSVARAMNDNLEVLGRSKKDFFGLVMSFYWNNGVLSGFDPPAPFDRYSAASINNVQQIVGTLDIVASNSTFATLFQHGQYHLLNDLVELPANLTLTIGIEVHDDGRLLVQGGGSGMGVVAVVLMPIGQPLGDLNHDCLVDVHDLQLLFESWSSISPTRGQSQGTIPADLNGDGVVNVSDLLMLFANWSH